MPKTKPENPYVRINLYVDKQTWKAFRAACIQRDSSASSEVDMFMTAQLLQWQSHDRGHR
jgi:hypothetical protein